ncbi:hypothetical protein D3OALGA1CA_1338 [Olavius algarvensis associated proteobacterium Delta 3]|nr:hypothetical protein D3OALGA1CA_1338 [Olavius algarvensis associated proteobacterium Delta 3]CAB5124592.1 hypothetical protein D3OALGB2SA_3199 [Olavius algarvensis associated proteobacterium Delta 3]
MIGIAGWESPAILHNIARRGYKHDDVAVIAKNVTTMMASGQHVHRGLNDHQPFRRKTHSLMVCLSAPG